MKKLPASLVVALGLSGCISDGCNPTPVGPCLSVIPDPEMDPKPDPEPDVGPCLEFAPPDPEPPPEPDVGPCLKVAPPKDPDPEPDGGDQGALQPDARAQIVAKVAPELPPDVLKRLRDRS